MSYEYADDLGEFIRRVSDAFDLGKDSFSAMKAFEQAHWDYIDNYNRRDSRRFPYMKNTELLERVLQHQGACTDNARDYIRQYERYKKSLPTAGCILLHSDRMAVVKIKCCEVYSMPKGKQDKGETLMQTAIRETREETGLDLDDTIGENTPFENIHKTRFYIVELDQPVRFRDYNRNEVSAVIWVPLNAIVCNPRMYSRQTVACAEYILQNMGLK
jgi:ADP-ribose pyrophosphatase YjhB (NUDIX family)